MDRASEELVMLVIDTSTVVLDSDSVVAMPSLDVDAATEVQLELLGCCLLLTATHLGVA